jgi:hypothetical protein
MFMNSSPKYILMLMCWCFLYEHQYDLNSYLHLCVCVSLTRVTYLHELIHSARNISFGANVLILFV